MMLFLPCITACLLSRQLIVAQVFYSRFSHNLAQHDSHLSHSCCCDLTRQWQLLLFAAGDCCFLKCRCSLPTRNCNTTATVLTMSNGACVGAARLLSVPASWLLLKYFFEIHPWQHDAICCMVAAAISLCSDHCYSCCLPPVDCCFLKWILYFLPTPLLSANQKWQHHCHCLYYA